MNFIRKIIINIIIYIFLFELLFQIFFFFNFNFIKQPILFYNGYCDQKYWNLYDKDTKVSQSTSYHPILSFKKNEVSIPKDFQTKEDAFEKSFLKNEISLYGSSYINHKEIKILFDNYKDINFTNYALESYGLDQIYLSYKLTSHLNRNKTIVFGFLLEDLDRSIFSHRDYSKVKFEKEKGNFVLKNIPIDQNAKVDQVNDFFLYRFLLNFYKLFINNFDPRQDKCSIEYKKELFNYFLEDIINESKKHNQKVLIITFNHEEDIKSNTSWRYKYVVDYLSEKNIKHIDSLKIMKNNLMNKNEKIENYFGNDGHNNKKSFRYIVDEFIKTYKAM